MNKSPPPEVDVEDQEVVDYIGVVAVLGMCVDDPIHLHICEFEKIICLSLKAGEASLHSSLC